MRNNLYIYSFQRYQQIRAQYDSNGLTACEQEQTARQIFYPSNGYELHVNINHSHCCAYQLHSRPIQICNGAGGAFLLSFTYRCVRMSFYICV